jgi:RNA polymerase-binding transcription factor DksA
MCEAMGYRTCDTCGNPVFPEKGQAVATGDLCAYCA